MEFDYVVKRQEKSRICFGSGRERKTLDSDVHGLYSKHARQNMKENIVTLMPGMYEVADVTSALSSVTKRPTSILGTVLGGRTSPRTGQVKVTTPGPGKYDIPSGFPRKFRPCGAPFSVRSQRKTFVPSNTPGVGQYSVAVPKCRSIPFAHSFGGKKTVLPAVEMKCGPFNFDTCERCNEAPEGDYWSLDLKVIQGPQKKLGEKKDALIDGIYLCRPCYEIEKKENKIFSQMQIRAFKKIRNCSKIHFHDGCKGKLYLVPLDEIRRLRSSKLTPTNAQTSLYVRTVSSGMAIDSLRTSRYVGFQIGGGLLLPRKPNRQSLKHFITQPLNIGKYYKHAALPQETQCLKKKLTELSSRPNMYFCV